MNQPDRQKIFKTNKALLFGHFPFAVELNSIATLPDQKDKVKQKIKDQIMVLANSYVSLATFVASEELEIITSVKNSLAMMTDSDQKALDEWMEDKKNKEIFDKAMDIYNRVLKDIENLKDEISKIDFI